MNSLGKDFFWIFFFLFPPLPLPSSSAQLLFIYCLFVCWDRISLSTQSWAGACYIAPGWPWSSEMCQCAITLAPEILIALGKKKETQMLLSLGKTENIKTHIKKNSDFTFENSLLVVIVITANKYNNYYLKKSQQKVTDLSLVTRTYPIKHSVLCDSGNIGPFL